MSKQKKHLKHLRKQQGKLSTNLSEVTSKICKLEESVTNKKNKEKYNKRKKYIGKCFQFTYANGTKLMKILDIYEDSPNIAKCLIVLSDMYIDNIQDGVLIQNIRLWNTKECSDGIIDNFCEPVDSSMETLEKIKKKEFSSTLKEVLNNIGKTDKANNKVNLSKN